VSITLLNNTRRLNYVLQNAGPDRLVFSDLTKALIEILKCNVYVISRKGRVLGSSRYHDHSLLPIKELDNGIMQFDKAYNDALLGISETRANITPDEISGDAGRPLDGAWITVVPVRCRDDRLGTLLFECICGKFETEDLVLAEYSATIVGMEIMRAKSDEIEEEARKKAVVQIALGTLSYSELEAIEHVLDMLEGDEGLLVASKIADKYGITRSVIVNALRKFESAGVIESRSLGMKGTHIKILNDHLISELKKLK